MGGRQYVVSVMEQEKRVSVCVCLVSCKRKVELGGGGGGTGVEILQSGATTPTQPRPHLQSQAGCQAPCGDTHQLGSTLKEEETPASHTHTLTHTHTDTVA